MGSVCPSSALGGLIDLDVAQHEFLGLETFYLGVSFEVGEEVQDDLH